MFFCLYNLVSPVHYSKGDYVCACMCLRVNLCMGLWVLCVCVFAIF